MLLPLPISIIAIPIEVFLRSTLSTLTRMTTQITRKMVADEHAHRLIILVSVDFSLTTSAPFKRYRAVCLWIWNPAQ